MEKFDALKAGFDQAKKEWTKGWTKASAGMGREGLLDYLEEHPYPNQQFAERCLALARENPHSPVAPLALTWVIKNSRQFVSLQLVDQALTIIAADHLQDAKLLETCQNPAFRAAPAVERFLRVVLEKHPDRKVRGFACLDLAEGLRERSELRAELEVLDEKLLAHMRRLYGDSLEEIRQGNPDQTEKTAAAYCARVTKEFADVRDSKSSLGSLGKKAELSLFELNNLGIGKVAPEIDAEDLDGKRLKLSDYRGKVVMLVWWATWCGPCMEIVGHERSLLESLKGKPFVVVGVNSDVDRETARTSATNKAMTWRSWWDGGSAILGPISRKWCIRGFPTIYVLDGEGTIRYKGHHDKFMDKAVQKLLQELETKGRKQGRVREPDSRGPGSRNSAP
jgi:peroxiredoxin